MVGDFLKKNLESFTATSCRIASSNYWKVLAVATFHFLCREIAGPLG